MCRFVWLWFFILVLFFILNATLVWHVATALCNIHQFEDWGNDNCLVVIMCVLPVCSRFPAPRPSSSSQWVSVWPSRIYFVTKSGFLLGDSYWWVSNYEMVVYHVKIHLELKKDLLLQSVSASDCTLMIRESLFKGIKTRNVFVGIILKWTHCVHF